MDLGKAGGVVNAEIAMASAKGLVKKKDSRLLAENRGYMVFTKDWAHRLLGRMGLVKRKANSKVKISANDFDKLKEHFLCSISALVLMDPKLGSHRTKIRPYIMLDYGSTGCKESLHCRH